MRHVRRLVGRDQRVEPRGIDGVRVVDSDPNHQGKVRRSRERLARGRRGRHPTGIDDFDGAPGEGLDLRLQPLDRAAHAVEVEGPGQDGATALDRPAVIEGEPEPAPQPFQEVRRCQPRIEIGGQVVQRGKDRRQRRIEGGHEALGEAVLLEEGRQRFAQRMWADQRPDQAAPMVVERRRLGDHAPSTSTWCSYE